MYIFLSHSSADAKIAEKMCSIIEKTEHRCFMAPRDIRKGHEYAAEIMDGLDNSDAMVLLLSKKSAESPHVLREIERAVSKKIPIIVYKLEEVELSKSLEYFLMTHQWITTPKSDYKDIVECIETLAAEKKSSKASDDAQVTGSAEDNIGKKHNIPVVIALSSILIAAVIIVASLLIRNAIKDKNDNKETTPVVEENDTTEDTKDDATTEYIENTENTEDDRDESGNVKVGDRIQMGQYNGETIEWRVLKISEDGTTAVLISQNILSVKAFNAAESGKGGYYEGKDQYGKDAPARTDLNIQKIAWGDSTWKNSTLRTWLNSSNEVVKYEGQVPSIKAFSDMYNDYSAEAGFLNGFTEEELDMIVETSVYTVGNALNKDSVIETRDKVFLLSVEELEWFEDSDIPLYAVPTEQAINANQDPTYKELILDTYKTDTCFWWLRDPVEGYSAKNYVVSLSVTDIVTDDSYYACVPSIGVRPAITIKIN